MRLRACYFARTAESLWLNIQIFGGKIQKNSRYYVCPNHLRNNGKTCNAKALNTKHLETAIKSILAESINDYLASNCSDKVFDTLLSEKQQQIDKLSKKAQECETTSRKFIEGSVGLIGLCGVFRWFVKLADDCLKEKATIEAEIQQLNGEVEAIQTLIANFKSKATVLTVDDIFYSDEVTKELFKIFIQRINYDDKNDDIEIAFNTTVYYNLG